MKKQSKSNLTAEGIANLYEAIVAAGSPGKEPESMTAAKKKIDSAIDAIVTSFLHTESPHRWTHHHYVPPKPGRVERFKDFVKGLLPWV